MLIPNFEGVSAFLLGVSQFSRNQWIGLGVGEVYLRDTFRLHPVSGQRVRSVEIGNITVRADCRGQGTFWGLCAHIRRRAPGAILIVENVVNDRLARSLRLPQNGFLRLATHGGENPAPPSFWCECPSKSNVG